MTNISLRSLILAGMTVVVSVLFAASCSSPQKATEANVSKANSTTAQQTTSEKSEENIDPVQVSPDKFKILLENEQVRVVEYSLKAGEKDNWHTHPPKTSYVVSGGKLKIVLENGEALIVDEKTGSASWMDSVGKHYAENIGDSTITILLTEIKKAREK